MHRDPLVEYQDPFKIVLQELGHLKEVVIKAHALREGQGEQKKKILDFEGARELLGYSKAHFRKMLRDGEIPYYRPNGGKVYFDYDELIEFALSNRQPTKDEISGAVALSAIK